MRGKRRKVMGKEGEEEWREKTNREKEGRGRGKEGEGREGGGREREVGEKERKREKMEGYRVGRKGCQGETRWRGQERQDRSEKMNLTKRCTHTT